ncbi:hypothetical protein EYF80_012632 [Liparis tanakae]|uniref:Uncharacterized protein n=1 Tax=Liparis tanakae TaxID=230148 RepID=A0A4Z2IJ10_9TELE|nr:hypothetical protein EYF80_012632 [Liparis tanakae]
MESLETSRVEEWAESQQGSGTAGSQTDKIDESGERLVTVERTSSETWSTAFIQDQAALDGRTAGLWWDEEPLQKYYDQPLLDWSALICKKQKSEAGFEKIGFGVSREATGEQIPADAQKKNSFKRACNTTDFGVAAMLSPLCGLLKAHFMELARLNCAAEPFKHCVCED